MVGRHPAIDLMGRAPLRPRPQAFFPQQWGNVCGISGCFHPVFPTNGQVRTCSSAVRHYLAEARACDLHALGTPPALILSQDQTRHQWWSIHRCTRSTTTQKTHRTRITRQLVKCDRQRRQKIEGVQTTPLDASSVVGWFASRRDETLCRLATTAEVYHHNISLSTVAIDFFSRCTALFHLCNGW
jgi:hypothetical protein